MTQILLVLKDKELSTILRGKVTQKYGVEVIAKSSAHEAVSLLEILPDIGIILCNEVIDKVQVASKLCDFLNAKQADDPRDIAIAVIGKNIPVYPKIFCVGENPHYQKILDYLGFLLGKEEKNVFIEDEKAAKEKAEREEAEKIEAEKAAKENAEKEKIEKEKAIKERAERANARIEKIEMEKAEKEREKAEKEKAMKDRIDRGNARLEKLEKEKAEKLEKEKTEKIEKEETEKLEKEKAEKLEKENAEKLEKERAEKLEKENAEKLKKENAEKLEKEKAMKERIDRGNARLEKLEEEKAEMLEKENAEKLKREKAIKERIDRGNARLEKLEKEKAEKLEKEKAEKLEKENAEKLEKENAEKLEKENAKTTVFRLPVLSPKKESVATLKENAEINTPEYSSMNVVYFLNLPEVSIDFSVYSRIKKSTGFEYNKKFNANSTITPAEIERVLLRSGKEFYISMDESSKANALLNGFFLERFKNPEMSWIDRMKLNSDSFEILLDLFKNSSFNKYNVEIIKELIKSIDIQVKSQDVLSFFLAGLNSRKLSYGYCHSFLTLYFLLEIADFFPWSKDQSKNKLLYLSLFHDLNLNTDRLIKLHHNYKLENHNLSDEEKQIVLSHAEAAANILEAIVKAPVELTALIKEHHGIKSGKGVIDGLSIVITPTSMAFIVIEDLVTQYLLTLEKMEGNKAAGLSKGQLETIFNELKKKYDRLIYLDVLLQLQKSMGMGMT